MSEEPEESTTATTETAYRSPTELFKGKLVELLFRNIDHNSNSRNNSAEKFAFHIKTRALSILLERYTPRTAKQETRDWYKQLKDEVNKIRDSQDQTLTVEKKEERILNLQYQYAEEVDQQNQRIIVNSPIIDSDVEGELDVNDEDIVDVIRRGKRTDDKKLEHQ